MLSERWEASSNANHDFYVGYPLTFRLGRKFAVNIFSATNSIWAAARIDPNKGNELVSSILIKTYRSYSLLKLGRRFLKKNDKIIYLTYLYYTLANKTTKSPSRDPQNDKIQSFISLSEMVVSTIFVRMTRPLVVLETLF